MLGISPNSFKNILFDISISFIISSIRHFWQDAYEYVNEHL